MSLSYIHNVRYTCIHMIGKKLKNDQLNKMYLFEKFESQSRKRLASYDI